MKNIANSIDLKELERKAWRSTFNDGLFDIYIGIMFFGISVGYLLGELFTIVYNYLFLFLILGIAILILTIGKRKITIPRMGFVKFGKTRKMRKKRILFVLLINVIILLIIYFITEPSSGFLKLDPPFNSLILGLFMIVPLCAIAYFLQFRRLYFYGIFMGLTPFLTDVFEVFMSNIAAIILVFTIIDGFIIFTGFVFLIKFLKIYPLLKDEV
ncbi:MAG: hypothetical protein EAX89_00035 [Candidatus Lokiarchaeota archaeon]|nr:hypothetical protein [Candidatus Lokiarchaeota archaeon]